MITTTYDTLNDLVHEVADLIERKLGLPALDRVEVNDALSELLGRYGVQFED